MGRPAIQAMLSAEVREAVKTGSREVAEEVAKREFSKAGLGTMKAVTEGLVSGGAGAIIESASQEETWRGGFVTGLKKVIDAAVAGG